jgi:elongator complex protein 4
MCHAFDLTREAGGETARTADLRCAPIGGVRNVRNPRSLADAAKSVSFSASFAPNAKSSDDDDGLRAAFAECVRLVERCDASCEAAVDEDDAPVGRIVLQFPDFVDDDASAARLARFLRGLRGVLRGGGGGGGATRATHPKWKRVCAVVTYPMASLSCAAAASLVHAVDAAIELETLPEKTATGEAHAAEALLPDPNLCVALLRVRKMAFPGPGAVAPSPLTRMDRAYALQVRRRRLAVRPLRIAPEDAANGAGHAPDGKTGKTRQSKPLCGGGPADASDALDF